MHRAIHNNNQTVLHNLNEYLMSNTDTSNLVIGGD